MSSSREPSERKDGLMKCREAEDPTARRLEEDRFRDALVRIVEFGRGLDPSPHSHMTAMLLTAERALRIGQWKPKQ